MSTIIEKLIRKSDRGLTFSFPTSKHFAIGDQYDYIIDKNAKSIRIAPSLTGAYKLSRKKAGDKWNALVDLRNKDIHDALRGMEQLRLTITDEAIIVTDANAIKSTAKAPRIILQFPRHQLLELRKASGISDYAAAEALYSCEQITFDEYLSSLNHGIHIPSVQSNLADVYTVVSLFSGAGILDWPFAQDKRFKIQYAIDYDDAACKTYRNNIGTHIIHGDVHKAFTENGYPLDKTISQPDIVIGGPSCKPFSRANQRLRLSEHPDSDLVVQFMRIINTLKPKVFAMENVPEVLTACNGAYSREIEQMARTSGYNIEAQIIQDHEVGGFTTRKRAVIMGSRIGKFVLPKITISSGWKTVKDALSQIDSTWSNTEDVSQPGTETKRRMSFVPQGGNYLSIPSEYRTASENRHSCTYRRLAWDEPAPTIVNWRKPPLIHPEEDRTLTVAEAKALQGLPGNFRICGTLGQMQQQVGNSVPVAIGTFIKNTLLQMLQRKPEFT